MPTGRPLSAKNCLNDAGKFSKVAALSPASDPYIKEGNLSEMASFGREEFHSIFGTYEEYLNSSAYLAGGYASADKEELPQIFLGCGDRDIAVGSQVTALETAFCNAGIEPNTRNSLRIPDDLGTNDAIVK